MNKVWVKHILLSYDKAENSSHNRPLGVAMKEAEVVIKDLKAGNISFEDAALKHSACASGPRAGGDLGWVDPQVFPEEFGRGIQLIGIDTIGPPIITDWGVHIVLRKG